ncbi:Hypothetical predicted protein [Mytilus galloprovincialis]|uniref:Calcineurin-like phosphoesterase domain-containing protein n=1 Tax=Mytilus galloprovincialis TaxID=29158 RepID=A0A8B6F2A3_MYTGA|nr:Hypothetical predicted protein [Mytilus galloprovincialis]
MKHEQSDLNDEHDFMVFHKYSDECTFGLIGSVCKVSGDFGYDLDAQNGHIGDEFLNLVQPIAGQVPYMTCPGNHENAYNFSNYKNRFTMPGDEDMDKMFYRYAYPLIIIHVSKS